jgi:hypothetical protein
VLSAAKNVLAGVRVPRCALLTLAVFGLLVVGGQGQASADPTALPANDGGGFGVIRGPADPEEYFWVIDLSENQELRQVDERTVAAYYTDNEHIAFRISAGAAHDAEGSSVPTSLVVSGADVVTRIIHHRAGDPAAGGAPFFYPITDGVGWEGGFQTHYIDMPDEPKPPVPVSAPAPPCIVPGLRGRSLATDRLRLARAGCTLGKVRGQRSRTARVVKQDLPAGTALPAGAKVSVKLAG